MQWQLCFLEKCLEHCLQLPAATTNYQSYYLQWWFIQMLGNTCFFYQFSWARLYQVCYFLRSPSENMESFLRVIQLWYWFEQCPFIMLNHQNTHGSRNQSVKPFWCFPLNLDENEVTMQFFHKTCSYNFQEYFHFKKCQRLLFLYYFSRNHGKCY